MLKDNYYISFFLPVRCDDFGGDTLNARYQGFIDYFYKCQKTYPGLFELCLLEYNPIDNKPIFQEKYKIPDDMDCKIWVLNSEIHESLEPERRFLMSYGNNVLMRKASGEFLMPVTQDLFFSKNLLEFLAQKKLNKDYFYRTDRLDFINPDPVNLATKSFEEIDDYAVKNASQIHIRHFFDSTEDISIKLNGANSLKELPRSAKKFYDSYDFIKQIIYCRDYYLYKKASLQKIVRKLLKYEFLPTSFTLWMKKFLYQSYLFDLHTNAAGDFLLAHRDLFYATHGFRESAKNDQFHADSFMVAQLTAAGGKQAILDDKNLIYNTDHVRGNDELEGRVNDNWEASYSLIKNILERKIDFRLNNENWGLLDKKEIYRIR